MKLFIPIAILVVLLLLSGCFQPSEGDNETFKDYSQPLESSIDEGLNQSIVSNQSIDNLSNIEENKGYLISSFYIQDFDSSKAEIPVIMNAIEDIVDDYDIVAIQGVYGDSVVLSKLNEIPNYNSRISVAYDRDRLVFLYSDRVIPGFVRTYESSIFKRKPYLMSFNINNYEFVLIQVYVDKLNAVNEIEELSSVMDYANAEYGSIDKYVVGNLYADSLYYDGNVLEDYKVLIKDATMIQGNYTYDNILTSKTNYNIESSGVDNLSDEINGDMDLLNAISSHYPIWMELSLDD